MNTNIEIFKPLEDFIRADEYTDSDVFHLIADFVGTSPKIGAAIARHAADITDELGGTDMTYTDVVVHLFWRTFYSPDHAAKYGTEGMVNDPIKLAQFAAFLKDPSKLQVPDLFDATRKAH